MKFEAIKQSKFEAINCRITHSRHVITNEWTVTDSQGTGCDVYHTVPITSPEDWDIDHLNSVDHWV